MWLEPTKAPFDIEVSWGASTTMRRVTCRRIIGTQWRTWSTSDYPSLLTTMDIWMAKWRRTIVEKAGHPVRMRRTLIPEWVGLIKRRRLRNVWCRRCMRGRCVSVEGKSGGEVVFAQYYRGPHQCPLVAVVIADTSSTTYAWTRWCHRTRPERHGWPLRHCVHQLRESCSDVLSYVAHDVIRMSTETPSVMSVTASRTFKLET